MPMSLYAQHVAAVLCASLCAGCASARRAVAGADTFQSEEAQSRDARSDEPDFKFMTDDMSYVKHQKDLAGQASEWMFGTRGSSDDGKHDIVRGHFCQRRGGRAETYYASSYCYWLPELEPRVPLHPLDPPGRAAVSWEGGAAPRALLSGASGTGRCVKASACHDNARSEDASVHRAAFEEQLDLTEGCLGESQIHDRCSGQFAESPGALDALAQERASCAAARARSADAAQLLSQCDSRLERLPRLIADEIPRLISVNEQTIREREGQWRVKQGELQEASGHMETFCGWIPTSNPYIDCLKQVWGEDHPAFQGLSFAELPGHMGLMGGFMGAMGGHMGAPRGKGVHMEAPGWMTTDDWHRHRCSMCLHFWTTHESSRKHAALAEGRVDQARAHARELEERRERAVLELQQLRDQRPDLAAQNESAAGEWSSRSEACELTSQKFRGRLNAYLSDCARSMYNASCERACLERAAPSSGCAVVEGDRPGSPNGRGGIVVRCAPPKPSWIWGLGQGETSGGQCDRIRRWQRPQYAQAILKTGWMYLHRHGINSWTPGYQWDKRFFVLEGSDQVRSAVLRYYDSDPSVNSSAEEHVNSSVILWDAIGVKEKQYSCPDKAAAFKIHHYYRDYRFCVLGDNSQTAQQARRDWMDMMSKEMRFRGVK